MMIQYQLTKSEVINAHHKRRRTASPKRALISLVVLATVILLVIAFLSPPLEAGRLYKLAYWLIAIETTAFVVLPWLNDRFIAFAVSSNANFNLPKRVSFTPNGLAYADPKYERTVEWRWYSMIAEDKHFYYLLRGSWWIDPVPKRAFDTASLEEFLKYCQSIPRA